MKKAFKTLAMTLVMALTITTMAFANPLQNLQDKLKALGVSDAYIGIAVEYLQKVELTSEQVNTVIAKAEEVIQLVGNQTDITKLDSATKSKIKSLAQEAAGVLNLSIAFDKDSITIKDAAGKQIVSVATDRVISAVKKLDVTQLADVMQAAAEFSNSLDKNKFTPINGTLNKTATNAGNVMAAGFGIVALAGALFVGSKKMFA